MRNKRALLGLISCAMLAGAAYAQPANDECTGAIDVSSGPFPFLTAPVDITTATPIGSQDLDFGCGAPSQTIWYKVTPDGSGTLTVKTCAADAPACTVVDTVIGIFDGNCTDGLSQITCNDDFCGLRSTVSASVTAGTTYYIGTGRFGTFGTDTGSIQLWIDAPTSAPTPPTGIGSSIPASVDGCNGGSFVYAVTTSPGRNPDSTGITVTADLRAVGGAQNQTLYDDGSNGDQSPDDGVYSYEQNVAAGTPAGAALISFTVRDAQNRSSANSSSVTIAGCNTTCAGADPLTIGTPVSGVVSAGSVEGPVCNGQTHSTGGVWYSVRGTGNTLTAALCGSSFDTRLTIYCAVDGCDNLICIGGNDDYCGLQSTVAFCTQPNAPYLVLVHGFGGSTGNFVLDVTDDGSPCTPTIGCGQSTPPSGVGAANPASTRNCGDQSVLLTVQVTAGSAPPSTLVTVRGNLESIGGSATQAFNDEGNDGDVTPGDGTYSYSQLIPNTVSAGDYAPEFAVADEQGRHSEGTIPLTITDICPPGNPWVESDDAGDLPDSAQVPQGSGSLDGITGTFDGSDTDMYLIDICDYENFSATTTVFTTVDTQLFLFNTDGTGVAMNDDEVGGFTLQSTLTNAFVPGNGQFYLAVSRYNRDPVDSDGNLIWVNTFRVEHAPDGPGAAGSVASWVGDSFGLASYTIVLHGACYPGGTCPPCAADFNNDGGVDGSDVEAFFIAWEAGEACGDVNQDGGVDGSDVEAFYTVWEAGGC